MSHLCAQLNQRFVHEKNYHQYILINLLILRYTCVIKVGKNITDAVVTYKLSLTKRVIQIYQGAIDANRKCNQCYLLYINKSLSNF